MALVATMSPRNPLRVRFPRLLNYQVTAYHPSRSRVHQVPAVIVVVVTMTNTEDSTDPPSQGCPAKDLQVIAVARERLREIRESNTAHREPTETNNVKVLGGHLLILVMHAMRLVTSHHVSLSAHSRCPALSPPETSLATHPSASL